VIVARERLLDLARAIRGRRIAVIGDLVLDRYWVGRSSRISREAPVLILDFEEERAVPGGASNAAANVRALGGAARLVGRIGADPAGRDLRRALRSIGVDGRWLARDGAGGTIVKTRVLAGSSHASRQQIVRMDRGHAAPLAPAAIRPLVRAAERAVRGSDAVPSPTTATDSWAPRSAGRPSRRRGAPGSRWSWIRGTRSVPSAAPRC
jgi:rfaE bifunctional protein kinase chain/domain